MKDGSTYLLGQQPSVARRHKQLSYSIQLNTAQNAPVRFRNRKWFLRQISPVILTAFRDRECLRSCQIPC
jgi:hypothetical protein